MHALEQVIDYRFSNPQLLKTALTHPSLGRSPNNQRLEFLGDAVLGMLVAKLLFHLYPTESEGELARRQASLIRCETLAAVARSIKLGEYLMVAGSEEQTGGRDNPTNLEDACEALIGAIFLDGGYKPAEKFVQAYWHDLARQALTAPKDAKTSLQEWAQGRGLPIPTYNVIATSGPAHSPQFTIEVSLPGIAPVCAEACTKRAAEQEAAKLLLAGL